MFLYLRHRNLSVLAALLLLLQNAAPQNVSFDVLGTTDSLIKAGESNRALLMLRPILSSRTIDDSVKAIACMQYGNCQTELDNSDSAIHFLKQAIEILHAGNDKKILFRAYTNLGNVLSIKTDYREPVKFYNDALMWATSVRDSLVVYIRMIALLLQNDRIDSAYQIVQNNVSKYPDDKGEIVPYKIYYSELSQGLYLNAHKQYVLAVNHLKKAAASYVPDVRYKLNAFVMLADLYSGMKDYANAFRYTDSANALVGEDGWAENRLQVYDLYTDLHEATGNFQKALDYSKQSRQLSDSFYKAEETAALTDAAEKYKNDKIQAEKNLAEKDKAIAYRNFVFTGVALVLVALLAALFLRNARTRRKANLLLTQQKQQVQQLADQLAVANDTKARLFSTIGHDLRSPISSLYASLKMQEIKAGVEDDSMSEHTVQLLDTLEDLLAWSKSQMDGFTVQKVKVSVPILMEDLAAFYITAASAKGIDIVNEAQGKIVLHTDENILKTVLRNVISNAIAHTEPGNSVLLSSAKDSYNAVSISVSNPCSMESFQRFQSSYKQAAVQSGVNGLGTVLIKEFAQKIGATVQLHYTDGSAVVSLSF